MILINHSVNDFEVKIGDRIAQLVLNKVERVDWESVISIAELNPTERGEGGFGSTGK